MFCTNCGTRIPDNANFCVGCGSRVSQTEPPAPAQSAPAEPPPVYSEVTETPRSHPAPPPLDVTAPAVKTKCSWCGAVIDSAQSSCPRCGARMDLPESVTSSGWGQLPGRKDMAKLQFGNSFCQVEGFYVPVADVNLAPGDSVYFAHHVLLWKEPRVNVTAMPMKGALNRLFAGMPLVMTQAVGPGHIAFSRDLPGELVPVPIQPGESIDVREHLFLAATGTVEYDWFQTGVWFRTQVGNESETHYPVGMFMDRFSAGRTPGLLLLHAGGNVFVRELAPGETILVKPTALIFKDPSVQMHLHFERPNAMFSGWGYWSNRYLWLRLLGPGRVAIQSVFEPIEGEALNISGFSYATEQRW